MRSLLSGLLIIACIFNFASCNTAKRSVTNHVANPRSLKFIGEYDVPYGFSYDKTTVGGLSGIDYNAVTNSYYMISDDRSAINPARFYTANIFITPKGIDSIQFTGVHYLQQPDGSVYPNNKQDPKSTPDPEAMRYNPVNKELVWSSEGERIVKGKDIVLSDPSVNSIAVDGKFTDSFSIPSNLHMQSIENGPRQNSVFEGLTFADNYKSLFVSIEEPLYEDGPRAEVAENNAYIRILKFDMASKKNISQYAYKLAPVAYQANPPGAFKINGVPDILTIADNKLLIIERSFSTGRLACTIRVFIADLTGATDIKDIFSLKQDTNFKPVTKKLLLNMDDLGIYIDNIEGVTFGPVLSNGHKTLLFIADNNFNPIEKSQLLLFEVKE